MSDKREQILARLLAIYEGLDGINKAYRNKESLDESERPGILMFDADERSGDTETTNAGKSAPTIVTMTPQTSVFIGDTAERVGTVVNEWRLKVLRAVLRDAELNGIVGTTGKIRYLGCATPLARGRKVEAELMLHFAISYPLIPNSL